MPAGNVLNLYELGRRKGALNGAKGLAMKPAATVKLAGKQIVLVDDNPDTSERLMVYFERFELQVTCFASALKARNYLQHNHPHAIISDLRLPEFTGLDLLQYVSQLTTPIPVILMSGIGNVSDVAEALRLGAADYLIKPIMDFDVVLHSLERALSLQALKRENEAYRQRLELMNRELKEHVQLLERDQQAAKQVQRNLLPVTPACYRDVELSHLVLPSLYLSGDFVDYGCIRQRYVAFYLTDVSGHGASSAFVTVWLKQLIRRLFRERQMFQTDESFDTAPADLLAVVNRELMQSRFFSHLTCVVGVIDTETNELCYVLAGHLPLPIILAPGCEPTFLEGKGKPVGLFEDATWEVQRMTLPKGFTLVMFSDGVLETLPREDLLDREQALLECFAGASTSITLNDIVERLELDCEQEAPDDIAMVLVKQLV